MPQPFRDQHDDYVRRYVGRPPQIIGTEREVEAVRATARSFRPNWRPKRRLDNTRFFIGVLRDI